MSISNVVAGKPIYRTKINEIISAAGAMSVSWVHFNGNTLSIQGGTSDIASITRNSPGAYKINFTDSKASANYSALSNCSNIPGNDTGFVRIVQLSRGYVFIECRDAGGGAGDCGIVCVVILGPDPNSRTSSASAIHLTASAIVDTVALGVFASSKYTVKANGTAAFDTAVSGSGLFAGDWIEDPFDVTLHQVRATLVSGSTPVGSALGIWLDFTVDRYWEISGDNPADSTLNIEIRDIASSAIRGSAQIILSLQNS